MILTLIAKKKEQDGKKWTNYLFVKNEKWYSVKFVKDCAPPQTYEVADGIKRAFIELTKKNKFDIKEGERAVVFVENYNELSAEALTAAVNAEKKKIEKFRQKREQDRINFLLPSDDTEIPF